MRKKVARKVSRANPSATATTMPATVPFASRLEDFIADVWVEDDVVDLCEAVVDAAFSGC